MVSDVGSVGEEGWICVGDGTSGEGGKVGGMEWDTAELRRSRLETVPARIRVRGLRGVASTSLLLEVICRNPAVRFPRAVGDGGAEIVSTNVD